MELFSFQSWVAKTRAEIQEWVESASELAQAAANGDEVRMQPEIKRATREQRTDALMAAANAGQTTTARILMDNGADASIPCGLPDCGGVYPLHVAVASGSVETATSLVTRGAPLDSVDLKVGWTPIEWARALNVKEGNAKEESDSMSAFLEKASMFMPAVQAVREGDGDVLRAWLAENLGRVDMKLGDNPRSLLLFATDWPGFWPNGVQSIELLLEAGADIHQRCIGLGTGASETPLHWAASSNDVRALDALVKGGAEVDVLGGCIANGTPLFLAVVFRNWNAARSLLAHGARYSLALVAALGDFERAAEFFAQGGTYHNPHGPMPHWQSENPGQHELDRSLWYACMGDQPEMAGWLLERGATWDYDSPTQTTSKQEASKHENHAWEELLG